MKTVCFHSVLRAVAAIAIIGFVGPAASQPGQPADPRGRWITASGNLEVEIAPCGMALCGTVTQVSGSRAMGNDSDAVKAADGRPVLGMKLLHDFVPNAGGQGNAPPTEWSGQIYNRENGKTYSCNMAVSTAANPKGELVLRAYVGLPLFGQTQRWQRAPVEASDAAAKP